ncbi:MAG: AtpZ/AtpI family protein [Flavobacteriales bacterium]|nr:AtpZ/AtpI family protein [Flavobacteriales bacterium]
MAFTMAATIGLFIYGGIKLDEYQGNETPGWTIAGALVGVSAGMYYAIKDLMKK